MGNKDDGFTVFSQVIKDFEETFCLLRGQYRSRLIQNDDAGTSCQYLNDLNPLGLTYRDLGYLLVQLNIHVVLIYVLLYGFSCGGKIYGQTFPRFKSQDDILKNSQLFYQHEFLMDHSDTGLNGCFWRNALVLFSSDGHSSRIKGIHSVQKLHHGGFSRTIFSYK